MKKRISLWSAVALCCLMQTMATAQTTATISNGNGNDQVFPFVDYTYTISNMNAVLPNFSKYSHITWIATFDGHVNGGSSTGIVNATNNGDNISNTATIQWRDFAYESNAEVSATIHYYKTGQNTNTAPSQSDRIVKKCTLNLINPYLYINGNAAVAKCDVQCRTYTLTDFGKANQFAWTIPSGWTLSSGQGTPTITVCPNISGAGTISCTARLTPSPSTYSKTASINVSRPDPNIGISTSNTYLCQGSTITASISGSTANLSQVNWVLPAGYSIVGNPAQPRTTITITGNTTAVTGNITASATYSGGCTSNVATKSVTVYTLAPPPAVPLSALETDIENEPLYSNNCLSTVLNSHSLNNVYTNGQTTITPIRLLFKRANEVKSVTICYKNLCTNVQTCRTFQVQAPACFNDLNRTAPNTDSIFALE